MNELRRELDFVLHDWLGAERLLEHEAHADHSRETWAEILSTAERIAAEAFAPHAAKADEDEPRFVDGTARTLPEIGAAWRTFADAGFLSAHWSADEGGIGLAEPVLRAAMAHFFAANVSTTAYPFLTIAAANVLRTFGSAELKDRYLAALGDGRCAGTMALTEPSQGSALGDLKTLARPHGDGSYRIVGQKMFISGGDQDFTENIVHMVLARIEGAPTGPRGLSLFLVPKRLVDEDGRPGMANDVALAGLLHKMGWRGTTSTVLSFGERGGAVGWLVGQPHQGLAHMFQMMNEARIGVGLSAASLAWRGFAESLAYARERPQGRKPSNRNVTSPQVKLVEHADVRRMLLAQKCYAEGALGLCLYASVLFEDQHSHPDSAMRERARSLLDLLTPVVKSWSSRYGCVSNDLAIQILGGSGYTREYPVERLYRDQRLNPIHEGAEAIHGLDLLGRKVRMDDGAALRHFMTLVRETACSADAVPALSAHGRALAAVAAQFERVTASLQEVIGRDTDEGLSNATTYLDAFGRLTVGWIWLQQALAASNLAARTPRDRHDHLEGKIRATHWYFRCELPQIEPQLALLEANDRTALDMRNEWIL